MTPPKPLLTQFTDLLTPADLTRVRGDAIALLRTGRGLGEAQIARAWCEAFMACALRKGLLRSIEAIERDFTDKATRGGL